MLIWRPLRQNRPLGIRSRGELPTAPSPASASWITSAAAVAASTATARACSSTHMRVRTSPGQTALMRRPPATDVGSSDAETRVSAFTAALEIEYAGVGPCAGAVPNASLGGAACASTCSTWREVVAGLVIWSFTGLGITAGYHRLFAHRSYRATPR